MNNPPFTFTKEKLIKIQYAKNGREIYKDDKERGLILMVGSGCKVFYLYKFIGDQPRKIKLGEFPYLSVEDAREASTNLKSEIIKGVFKKKEEKKSGKLTFKELYDKYINDYAVYNIKRWKEERAMMNRRANCLYDKKLSDVAREDIQKIFIDTTEEVGKRSANKLIIKIRAIFNMAIQWELLDKNPVIGITKHKEKSRDRYITSEEMIRFIQAIKEEPNKAMADFFMMCLYTAARRSNVQAMRWENISFTDRTWYLPDTKNGTPQTIPLIPYATEILERRNNENVSNSEWVFPAKSHTGHLQEPKKVWYKILERAGIEDLRMHDLRRTLGSIMAQNGTSLHIVGKALNHKSSQSTNIYARLNVDPVRRAMEGAGETINIRYEV